MAWGRAMRVIPGHGSLAWPTLAVIAAALSAYISGRLIRATLGTHPGHPGPHEPAPARKIVAISGKSLPRNKE